LIANGILMGIAADLPYMSRGWGELLVGTILPVLGVAHLIYISNTEQRMEISA